MCEPPERRDMRQYWTEGPGGEPLINSDLLHVTCCDRTVAFCGERLRGNEKEGYAERTEDCLSCLREETRRERANLGCGSPQCPHQPLRGRLMYLLRRFLRPRDVLDWALLTIAATSGLWLIMLLMTR